ncbi:hypothetical protein EGW08_012068, partial [Elysia chlorotica]
HATTRGAGKYYRKPGLPGTGYKPAVGPGSVRPLLRQTTSLEAIPKSSIRNNGGTEAPDLAILTPKQSALKSLQDQRAGNTSLDDVTSRKAVYSSAASWRSRNHTSLGLGKDTAPTIPVRNKTQLHLNGVAAKSNGSIHSDSKPMGLSQGLSKQLHKITNVSTKHGRKLANFSDIQRDDMSKKKIQVV